jgi:hypothetical protein
VLPGPDAKGEKSPVRIVEPNLRPVVARPPTAPSRVGDHDPAGSPGGNRDLELVVTAESRDLAFAVLNDRRRAPSVFDDDRRSEFRHLLQARDRLPGVGDEDHALRNERSRQNARVLEDRAVIAARQLTPSGGNGIIRSAEREPDVQK